jgi:prepilin-type N-terminal cleavage/methylation domain-containing protein
MKKLFRHNQGFSLIEMLIYLAILVVIFLLIVQTVLSYTRSYRQLFVLRALDRSAYNSFERMTRDIRSATSITSTSTAGTLVIAETSSSGVSTTTKFYISNGKLLVDVNNVLIGPLTVKSTQVTSLTFQQLAGTTSAIKIDMALTATSGPVSRSKLFHTTVLLQGS